jgi:serine phosphatase RsbU (regulator of sigma subunit)
MQLGNVTVMTNPAPSGLFAPSGEEMEAARQVQTRLLRRRIPQMENLACGGCYLPAGGIGGDYYDFIHLGLRRVGLVLGDISGKGVPAALMMASLQAILRSHSPSMADDLPRLLRSVNRLFCECTGESNFASLFLGDYHDTTRCLHYVNCGHTPPLLVHPDFSVDRLAATATVLGMFLDWDCSVGTVALAPGDTLLLFTDGVTEAINDSGEEFGEGRLLDVLKACRHATMGVLVCEMAAAVRRFGGNHLIKDDVTLLVARSIEPR